MKFHVLTGTNHSVCIRVDNGDLQLKFWSEGELSKFASAAVRAQIDRAVNDQVEAIRRAAYELGWKDAKARAKKKSTFWGCLNADPSSVGY